MASLPLDTQQAEAQPAKTGLFRPFDPAEWRQFVNWALVWIVLANVAFASMWLIGAPPRRPEIYAAGAIGLLVRRAPVWVQCAAFLASLTYSILGFIAGLFNLSILSLLHSLKFFAEINPANSWEYIAGGGLLLGILVLSMWVIRRPQAFSDIPIAQ